MKPACLSRSGHVGGADDRSVAYPMLRRGALEASFRRRGQLRHFDGGRFGIVVGFRRALPRGPASAAGEPIASV